MHKQFYSIDQILELQADNLRFGTKERQLLNIIQDLAIIVDDLGHKIDIMNGIDDDEDGCDATEADIDPY